ncbi:DNA-binding transcriptional LysR family regulator [Streptomyces sp. SAI-135]|uniref:LysR family transcriptional regulator n=1 Tax=unclassified Streptomyces TaxID=2593676 RepID=UPI002472F459|nr:MULTISPECIES: LysR family transcriptional regulator [unclassified Streptomyces]MDH6514063.1 DNA-binding transcriptional LysR family regulator [Streptomyces sp. SAI-090]MDH6621857.1 DNA-binding transcriptional LysR family regulator [Streptomyces sp. SAI-135]
MNVDHFLDGRLKLRHLVLVTVVADEGTLVGAAKAMHVTQPVVTRSLQEIETIIGVELFARGPRGVRPTQYGDILIEHARAVVGNVRAAAERIHALQRLGMEPVRVGTNLAGAYSLLPQTLIRLKKAHPHLTVSVVEAMPEELGLQLSRGEVDVLVGRLQPSSLRAALRHLRLYDEPVRLVVRREHPCLGARAGGIEDLMDLPWILPGRNTQLRQEIDELFDRRGLPLPANIIECSTILTLRTVLLETDAVAPLPMLIGARDPLLDMLPLTLDTVPREIGITTLADRPPSASTRLLIKGIVEVARDTDPVLAGPKS